MPAALRFGHPSFRHWPEAVPVACDTTQGLSRRQLTVKAHCFFSSPYCCLLPKRCYLCAVYPRRRQSRSLPPFVRLPEEFARAQSSLPALGIAIGRTPPREPSRAGLSKREKGASWKYPSQNSIVLINRSLRGGFGSQIVQLTTDELDGL